MTDTRSPIVAECWTCDGPPGRRNRGRCEKFLRRVRPYGYNIVCEALATHETWVQKSDGTGFRQNAHCAKHPDTARYSETKAGTPLTSVLLRAVEINMDRHRAAGHDVRPVREKA